MPGVPVADVVFGLLFDHGFEAAMVVARADRTVVSANRQFADLTGLATEVLIGHPIDTLLLPDSARHGPSLIDHAGRYEDVAVVQSDGYARYVDLTVIHLEHADHGPLAACIARDITERRELERDLLAKHSALYAAHAELERMVAELRAAHRQIEERNHEIAVLAGQVSRVGWRAAIGELAAGLAHNLNNPVGALTSTLRTVATRIAAAPDHPARPELESLLARARAAAGRIEEHVGAVVRLHRTGALGGEPRWLDLGRELDTALSLFAGRLDQVAVRKDYARGRTVHVPQEPLHHVVGAVIENALTAMPGGGELGLAVLQRGDRWVIAIDDAGAGLSPEQARRLFDPVASAAGGGLGLVTAQRLARLWGGDLAHCARPRGARFEITIPVAEPSGGPDKESP